MLHCSKIGFSSISKLLAAASVLGVALTLPSTARAAIITDTIIVADNSTGTLESPSGETTTITTIGSAIQIGAGGILNTIGDILVTESYHSIIGNNGEIHYSNGTLSFSGNLHPDIDYSALEGGGAIYADRNITFIGSNGGSLAFDSNRGGSFGGAIVAYYGSVTFQGNTTGSLSITNNTVRAGADGYPDQIRGGAIYVGLLDAGDINVQGTYGSVNISNNLVVGDGVGIGGGAFYAENGSINIDLTTTSGDVAIVNNTITG